MDGDGTFALMLLVGLLGSLALVGCVVGFAREYLALKEGETTVGGDHPWARRAAEDSARLEWARTPVTAVATVDDHPHVWAAGYGRGEEDGSGRELVGVGGRRAYGYVGGELVPLSGLAVLVPSLPEQAWN